MRLTTFSDSVLLVEQHRIESRKILKESCEGLTKQQRLVVENVYKHFLPLIEATLSGDQISQLFGEVEKATAAGGQNKTALGKAAGTAGAVVKGGAEAVKKANDILNQAGSWLKNTTPVQNFDAKYNELKTKVIDKLGGEDSKIVQQVEKLGKLAKDNPGKTAAVIGVLTVLAGLAAGPVGGIVAGQVLRGASELIQGKDLSTAVGKGLKTAAVGAVAGGVGDAVAGGDVPDASGGDTGADVGGGETSLPPAEQAKVDKLTAKYPPDQYEYQDAGAGNVAIYDADGNKVAQMNIKSTGMNGQQFTDYVEQGSGSGTTSAAQPAGDELGRASTSNNQPASSSADGNLQGVTSDQIRNHPAYQAEIEKSGNTPEGRKAASLAARTAMAKGESVYRQQRPLSEGQVYLLFNRVEQLNEGPLWDKLKDQGKKVADAAKAKAAEVGSNLANKVTAAKLNAAWKKAGSPTESNELANFLKQQGVGDDVIGQVYQGMNIEMPADQQQEPEQDQAQDQQPQQQPAQTQAQQQPAAVPSVKLVIEKIKKLAPEDRTSLLQDLKQEIGTA